MIDLVVVGTGNAFQKYYLEAIPQIPNLRIVGVVDKSAPAVWGHELLCGAWKVKAVWQIPKESARQDTAILLLTPEHYESIVQLAEMGFKDMIVEKPLVSRFIQLEPLRDVMKKYSLRLCAMDSYIPKLFSLLCVCGKMAADDPRRRFLKISGEFSDVPACLGRIEGVSVSIIEAGDFCLPDLAKRPWLEHDAEIGGMLLDLGTHALAPLVAAGLMSRAAQIHDVKLSRLSLDRSGLIPLRTRDEVEMYVSAFLTEGDLPIQVAFGKVPFQGGVWSVAIRGEHGMMYAGLRSGQPAVIISNRGDTTVFSLTHTTYVVAMVEAMMYFRDELRGFDGHTGAFFASMDILNRMRHAYFDQMI